jgi:1,4-dihydroxy-6-naphthoate synthase
MKISIGFSPCPNDTYLFDAMVNQTIDTAGIEFDVHIEDVETLNQWALEGRLDVTKLSFPALFGAGGAYRLLDSGAALGKGVGPLLVARSPMSDDPSVIEELTVALPGKFTTAHLLFSMAYSKARHKEFMLFSEIESAILQAKVELGVLIHENRFTYQAKGLHRIIDLGTYWEQQTGLPLPLGGIAIKSSLAQAVGATLQQMMVTSLLQARRQQGLSDFVRSQAQSMEPVVMQQHIDLYVNDYTMSLGTDGKKAIRTLHELYRRITPDQPAHQAKTNDNDIDFFLNSA